MVAVDPDLTVRHAVLEPPMHDDAAYHAVAGRANSLDRSASTVRYRNLVETAGLDGHA